MWWALVSVVVIAAAAAFVVVRRRSRRQPDGMQSFRRHMDALSSDARSNVIGRVRDADAHKKGGRYGA